MVRSVGIHWIAAVWITACAAAAGSRRLPCRRAPLYRCLAAAAAAAACSDRAHCLPRLAAAHYYLRWRAGSAIVQVDRRFYLIRIAGGLGPALRRACLDNALYAAFATPPPAAQQRLAACCRRLRRRAPLARVDVGLIVDPLWIA
jgi:hypothetical protein